MKRHMRGWVVTLLLATTPVTHADRTLEKDEVQNLFDRLTKTACRSWITAGTVRASHTEYRAPRTTDTSAVEAQIKRELVSYENDLEKVQRSESLRKMKIDAIPFNVRYEWLNEHTMTTTETIASDGERFSWAIEVHSRKDSVQPDPDLIDNPMSEQFNLEWNGSRLFTWDGDKHTTYCMPVNRATVDAAGRVAPVVNGAWTAGFVPWGYGLLSADSLHAAEATAVEKEASGSSRIHLTLRWSGDRELQFVLDPGKDLAPLSALAIGPGPVVVSTTLEGHRKVGGHWVPTAIYVERRDSDTSRMLGYDEWSFESIDATTPPPSAFVPPYRSGAVIQYASPMSNAKALLYEYSDLIDTDRLLADRLAVAAAQGTRPQNCATLCLDHVTRQLGCPIPANRLRQAVDSTGATSLFALRQLAQGQGLHCRAVQTDLTGLRRLNTCGVILHIPERRHFVVLAGINERNVWLIDLTRSRFFYHVDAAAFSQMQWTSGLALLVSKQPIASDPDMTDLSDSQLTTLTGATGYSCTDLLQHEDVVPCDQVSFSCSDYYELFWKIYGCEQAPSGVCAWQVMESRRKSPCVSSVFNPYFCDYAGEWIIYYIRACGYESDP